MANKRIYYAQGCTFNTQALGGTSEITVEAGWENVLQSAQDGLLGTPEPDKLVLVNRGSVASEDVKHFLTLLASTASEMTFYGRESGTNPITYGKGTLDDPQPLGGTLAIAKSGPATRQYARMTVNFEAIHAAADDFDDVLGFQEGQSAPAYTDAERLIDPIAMTHDGNTILHPTSLNLSVQPVGVLRACDDSETGISVIDIAGYSITGSIGFADITQQTGPPTHERAIALVKASRGSLVTTVRASRGGTNQVITSKNCDITRYRGRRQAAGGYWEHVCEFMLGWLDDSDNAMTLAAGDYQIVTIANV